MGLRLFFLPNFPGATFNPDSGVTLLDFPTWKSNIESTLAAHVRFFLANICTCNKVDRHAR
jgi:hypothetical protein